jgi:hypothetical protein
MKVLQLLDKAALTLHEGFFTNGLGDRGAAAAFILITSVFPSSLGFCFWLGIGLATGLVRLPTDLGLIVVPAMAVILMLVGAGGLWFNLLEMAGRPAVRGVTSPRESSSPAE